MIRLDQEAEARGQFAVSQGRRGDWMQTASGRMFWPLDPRADEVFIEDIAHALANLCRFAGHCKHFYSVAQHSVYVSHQVPPQFALDGLLHDGGEAYCIDMPRPLKRYIAGYQAVETRVQRAVAERFGLSRDMPECVHAADNAVLLAEKEQIMLPSPAPWSVPGEAAKVEIVKWTPAQARVMFLRRYHALRGVQ